jgi:hypothetical protein
MSHNELSATGRPAIQVQVQSQEVPTCQPAIQLQVQHLPQIGRRPMIIIEQHSSYLFQEILIPIKTYTSHYNIN